MDGRWRTRATWGNDRLDVELCLGVLAKLNEHVHTSTRRNTGTYHTGHRCDIVNGIYGGIPMPAPAHSVSFRCGRSNPTSGEFLSGLV